MGRFVGEVRLWLAFAAVVRPAELDPIAKRPALRPTVGTAGHFVGKPRQRRLTLQPVEFIARPGESFAVEVNRERHVARNRGQVVGKRELLLVHIYDGQGLAEHARNAPGKRSCGVNDHIRRQCLLAILA